MIWSDKHDILEKKQLNINNIVLKPVQGGQGVSLHQALCLHIQNVFSKNNCKVIVVFSSKFLEIFGDIIGMTFFTYLLNFKFNTESPAVKKICTRLRKSSCAGH